MSIWCKKKKLSKERRERFYIREKSKTGGCLYCIYCGKEVYRNPPHPSLQATIEHIIPRSRGGSNRKENLAVACKPCNNNRIYPITFKLGDVA